MNPILRSALVACLALAACKGGDKPAPASSSENPASPGAKAAPAGVDLLAGAKVPDGTTLTARPVPFGTLSLPTGKGWETSDGTPLQVESEDGTVLMLQGQDGIEPSQLDEYLASYDEVQKRDAPKYAEVARTKGTVAGEAAARVEGTFDNGTKFKTRDYVVITRKGKVAMIMGRAPVGAAADRLPGLVDAIAASVKF